MFVYFYDLVEYVIHYYMQFYFRLGKNNLVYILGYAYSEDFFSEFPCCKLQAWFL